MAIPRSAALAPALNRLGADAGGVQPGRQFPQTFPVCVEANVHPRAAIAFARPVRVIRQRISVAAEAVECGQIVVVIAERERDVSRGEILFGAVGASRMVAGY